MDNDDRQLGHILSRREVLALLGTAGIAILAGCGPTQSGAVQPTSATGPVPATTAATAAPTATATSTTGATAAASQTATTAASASASPAPATATSGTAA